MNRAAGLVIAIAIAGCGQKPPPKQAAPPPPVKQQMAIALPPFELTERSGKTVTRDDLQGKAWIANFIFTRCAGPCPALTAQFYTLQEELKTRGDDVRLVTFTVDPDYDTPDVLAERARIAHADPDKWLWLTGERPAMWELIKTGFYLPVYENAQDKKSPIAHSQKFVLVDQTGNIRGYFDGLDAAERAKLKLQLDQLLK